MAVRSLRLVAACLVACVASIVITTPSSTPSVEAEGAVGIRGCTANDLGIVERQGTTLYKEDGTVSRQLPAGGYDYNTNVRNRINFLAGSFTCNPTGAPTTSITVERDECIFIEGAGVLLCVGGFTVLIGQSDSGTVRAWLDPAEITSNTSVIQMFFSGQGAVFGDNAFRARATWYGGMPIGYVNPQQSVHGFPAGQWTRAFRLQRTNSIEDCAATGGFYQSGAVQTCEFAIIWDDGAQSALAGAGRLGVAVPVPWAYWRMNEAGNNVIGSSPYSATTLAVGRGDISETPALEVDLDGGETEIDGVVEVVATIENLSDGPIDEIVWEGGGLLLEELLSPGVVELREEPGAGLPSALGPGEQVRLRWRFDVTGDGIGVFSLNGSGQLDGEAVSSGLVELSLIVGDREVVADDIRRAMDLGIRSMLSDAMDVIDGIGGAADLFAEAATPENRSAEAFRQAYEGYRAIGFSHWSARAMAANDLSKQSWETFWTSFGTARKDQLDATAQGVMSGAFSFYYALRDPTARSAMAQAVGDAVREHVPTARALMENYGLIGEGWLGQAGLYYAENGAWLAEQVYLAGIGDLELTRQSAQQFRDDPVQWADDIGARYGEQMADVEFMIYTGVVEEALTVGSVGLYRGGRALVSSGVSTLRTSVPSTAGVPRALDAGGDAIGSAVRQVDDADRFVRRFQDLPYDFELDLATLERLGGFSSADVGEVQAIIGRMKERYGVDLQIVARTAEPLSVGLEGVGKRQFTSYKAVGVLDQQMGAPEILGGRVTVFEPQPLPSAVVEALEQAEPGFAARYAERFATQQKYWDEWQSGSGKMNRLVEGSIRHDGITVINEVPRRPTYGVDYLEQLNEPAYVQSRGWSPEQVAQIRSELETYPNTTRSNMRAQEVDGAVTFVELVEDSSGVRRELPILSDYDLQAVIPDDGWPPGLRGQIETDVKREFDRIGRSGRHGWSHTANDLPSAYFDKAAEYILGTTHPAAAEQVGGDILRRFRALGDEFADRAAGLPPGDARRLELERIAAKFRSYLTEANGSWIITAGDLERLLDRFPPGEKTIVFSRGRVAVGSGDGAP